MDTFVRLEIRDNLAISRKRQAIDNAIARMKELEKLFDYFSEDSEVSKLNSGKKISLSPEMNKVLGKSEKLRRLTGGAFDVRIAPDNKINLGGIAKGFIVDEGISSLKKSGIKNALINAGGDMYCMGNAFMRIGIRDPKEPSKIAATVRLRNKGVATSGSYERPAHIIDPQTGRAVEKKLRSTTVIANDCMTADGLATALYVLGAEEGLLLIESIDDAECIILDDGKIYRSSKFQERQPEVLRMGPSARCGSSHS